MYFDFKGFIMKFIQSKKAVCVFLALFAFFSVSLHSQGATAAASDAEKKEAVAKSDEDSPSDMTGWRVTDFQPYIKALAELEKLSDEYSENLLKMAIDEYSTGLDILSDMEVEVNKLKAVFAKKNNLNERWYWQEIDRKNQEKRQISYLKYEAKVKSITYFTRAINHMDDIQSVKIKADTAYINAQIKLFQAYVSTQYDIQNLLPCIPVLERYVQINEKTKNDVWAYNYMASCYGFMEASTAKSRIISEEEKLKWKQKKNRSLLTAAELKYGIDTPQYKHLKETVELDEKKSASINDFR